MRRKRHRIAEPLQFLGAAVSTYRPRGVLPNGGVEGGGSVGALSRVAGSLQPRRRIVQAFDVLIERSQSCLSHQINLGTLPLRPKDLSPCGRLASVRDDAYAASPVRTRVTAQVASLRSPYPPHEWSNYKRSVEHSLFAIFLMGFIPKAVLILR